MFSALSLTDLPRSLQHISPLNDGILSLFDFLPTPKWRSITEIVRTGWQRPPGNINQTGSKTVTVP